MKSIPLNISAMRSAQMGEDIAVEILDAIDQNQQVELDFRAVEIMTPSFANALIMTLLSRHSLDDLRRKCLFQNRSSTVISMMNRAVTRYSNGIRLTAQPSVSA